MIVAGCRSAAATACDRCHRSRNAHPLHEGSIRIATQPGSGPIAHGLIGRHLEIADIDGAYATLLGRTRDQVVGRGALDFTHPDDRPAGTLFLRRAWDQGTTLSATQRHMHADGSMLWTNIYVSRIGTGDDRRLVVTCRPLASPSTHSGVEAQWQMARLLLQALDGGKRAFGETLIGNPATEILLLAYLAEAEARAAAAGEIGRRMNIAWPLTRRWLYAMFDAGFIEAEALGAPSVDRPIRPETPIRLTPRALAMIEAIFGALITVVRGATVPV